MTKGSMTLGSGAAMTLKVNMTLGDGATVLSKVNMTLGYGASEGREPVRGRGWTGSATRSRSMQQGGHCAFALRMETCNRTPVLKLVSPALEYTDNLHMRILCTVRLGCGPTASYNGGHNITKQQGLYRSTHGKL